MPPGVFPCRRGGEFLYSPPAQVVEHRPGARSFSRQPEHRKMRNDEGLTGVGLARPTGLLRTVRSVTIDVNRFAPATLRAPVMAGCRCPVPRTGRLSKPSGFRSRYSKPFSINRRQLPETGDHRKPETGLRCRHFPQRKVRTTNDRCLVQTRRGEYEVQSAAQ